MIQMKKSCFFVLLTVLVTISGCAVTPPPDSSWVSIPKKDQAGIYFYQHKTGFVGGLYDVGLYINGKKLGEINTGEWLYFDYPAGKHHYYVDGPILPTEVPVEFKAGNNYFFRGSIFMASPLVVLVTDPKEIKEAHENIQSGRYEHGDKD